jgi:hypothetical protein
MKRALADHVLSGAPVTSVVNKAEFESQKISLNQFSIRTRNGGAVEAVSSASIGSKDLIGAIKAKALNPTVFAKFLEEIGVVGTASGTTGDLTKQFSALFATFMSSGFVESSIVENSLYNGIPTKTPSSRSASDVMGVFLTKLKASSIESWQQAYTLFENTQKRVVGIAQTGCPANKTGHIYREDDLNRRTIDIRLTAQRIF